MSYTRKHKGKKSKMTRNIRNRNYKKNNKNNKKNKKYGGVVPAVTISTATKAGLFGKKAISAVKVGSKISKGNLSGVGVGLLDDTLLHSGSYFFGKKGKKNKKQRGGDGGAIDALKTTLETADKIPGITFIPAYKIFSGIKKKLFDLLDIVQNEDIQNVLNNPNNPEMPTEEIKKQIKNIINKNENIKNEINKYKEVCSNLDKISGLPIIGTKIADAIPHREELCMAFIEFDETENIEENTTKIENPLETSDSVLENNENIDTQESTNSVIEENTTKIENSLETTDDVLDNNDNNDNIDTQESTDTVLANNDNTEAPETTGDVLDEDDKQNKNNTNFLKQNTMIENPFEKNDNVLENNNKNKNCVDATGISRLILGKNVKICYPDKQEGAGSRKNKKSKKSKKSNKKPRKGSRNTKKSYKRQHRKK